MVARSFAFKRQRNPLLSYPLLNPVAPGNLISLLMFHLKELRGPNYYMEKLCVYWYVVFSSDFAIVINLLAHCPLILGRYLRYMVPIRVTLVLRLPTGSIIWIYLAHKIGF